MLTTYQEAPMITYDAPFGPMIQDALDHAAEMYWEGRYEAEECAFECAAERAMERALYGPTEAMLADYEVEREREAHDPFLMYLEDRRNGLVD